MIDLYAVDRSITAVAAAADVDRSLCCRSITPLSTTTKILSGSLMSIDLAL
jgi:hypothetical protein